MKNIALLISTFFLLNINFSYAQIAGNIEDRLEESLITEYFPNYSKVKNNDNDSRIIEVLNNETIIGYIYSTWDMVKSLGYDRSPYEIIVGLNTSGTIADTVHRGTISSNLMHQAIFKSSRNAALSIGLFEDKEINRLDYLKEVNLNWDQLIKNNYVLYRKNYISEYLIKHNNKSKVIKNSEIAITLITPRAIGYNLLKKNRHDKYMAGLNRKDHAILIAGNGYSFKGDKWRYSKKFDRIRLIQGKSIINFKADDHTRISKIQAKNYLCGQIFG